MDIETVYVEFHNQAKEMYFALFRDFNASIEGVNRDRDESQFRLKREQYVHRLEQQLQELAEKIVEEHQVQNFAGQLSQNLRYFIQDYVHQFVQKVKAL